MLRLGSVVIISLVLAGASLAQDNRVVELGHRLVVENCSRCHSVEKFGNSPLPKAPAFRTLHERYPVEDLAEALAEGIVTGHAGMPQFVFQPDQVGAIIAYLKTLEP
jgi:mono/diheme cytochrome c family protein